MKTLLKFAGSVLLVTAYLLIVYVLSMMIMPDLHVFDFSSYPAYFYWAAVLLIPFIYLKNKGPIHANGKDKLSTGDAKLEAPEGINANVIIAAFAFYPTLFTVAYTVQHALFQTVPAFFEIELSAGIPFYLPFFICNAAIAVHLLFKSMKRKALKNNSLHF
ncbi:hypothetical protein [Bacillus marinisedimentorum]|uniref:hypothetical protein n=1 Tax=Bacillus marinisedimentorum TaxID=1821260 RepID=UPI000871B661|nr:hypothetical protein [Bacillus marinisedimentorum]